MPDLPIAVRRIADGMPLPSYAHQGDAGADLHCSGGTHLPVGARKLVPTGIAVAIPEGYVGLVHPRSGLAAEQGVTVLNAPGTVDAGYRGEVMVNLINHGSTPVFLHHGDRIAQLVIQKVERAAFHAVDDLGNTERGTGGHGSTGVRPPGSLARAVAALLVTPADVADDDSAGAADASYLEDLGRDLDNEDTCD